MAKGFKIVCENCGSQECRLNTYYNGEFTELEYVCDDCGQVE